MQTPDDGLATGILAGPGNPKSPLGLKRFVYPSALKLISYYDAAQMVVRMAIEIERKFLVNGDGWRQLCTKSERLKDGLIAISGEGTNVRVRLYEGRATLTVKSRGEGWKNAEFEYEIPVKDAHELIDNHCGDYVLTKTRHYVPYRGFNWQVDVYHGLLDGVMIAEVEIESINTEAPLPPWIGREVTTNQDYHKINMLRKRLAQVRTERISAATLRHY